MGERERERERQTERQRDSPSTLPNTHKIIQIGLVSFVHTGRHAPSHAKLSTKTKQKKKIHNIHFMCGMLIITH